MSEIEEIEMVSVDELLERTLAADFDADDQGQTLMIRYIRRLKNAVIGSSRQKENVFNHSFVPTLLTMLNNESLDVTLRTDVAIIIGSLTKGKADNVQKLINYNAVPSLLEGLKTSTKCFVDACLRALRSIYQSKNAPVDEIYSDPATVSQLLSVAHNSVCAQECVGAILMKSCSSKRCQNLLHSQGVIGCFAPLLFSPVPQIKLVALGLFASIIRNNREVSEVVAFANHMGCPILDQIKRILSQENELDVHLEAARCVTYLCRSGAMSTTDNLVVNKVMPMLVRTCRFENNPYVKTRQRIISCETLAHLIEEDLSLQRLTSWNNMCLQVMSQCLNCTTVERAITDENEKADLLDELHQAAILVLAALASNDEDIRKKIAQEIPNLLDHIMRGLYRNSIAMQLASAKCLHSFSRSVEQIRTIFMDKPVSRQLLMLMQSDDVEVSSAATAVVANLVLEFSPCKSALIDCGCVTVLCDLAKSEEISSKLNGVWGLMNLAYRADDKIKSLILRYFTPADMLRALTESPADSPVVCRLLGLIRNLLSNKEHTDQLMSVWGTSIIQTVIFVLEGDYRADDKEQALNVLANVSYGNLAKDFIISNEDVLRKITNYLMHANPKFQIAAAFTVCNLVWKDDPGYLERQAKLKELGFSKVLSQLLQTKDTILFDKVKMAMQNLGT